MNKGKHCREGGQRVNRDQIMQGSCKELAFHSIKNRKPLEAFEQKRGISRLHFIASFWFSVENRPWREQGCNQLEDCISNSDGDLNQNGSGGGVKKWSNSGNIVKVESI